MNQDNIHVLILSAGKIVQDLEGIFGTIPSGLIPINGKPIIFRIIDKLLDEGFSKISVTVGYRKNDLIKIIDEHYNNKVKVNFIDADFTKSPGNSILKSIDHIKEDKLLVILGDTLVEENLWDLIKNNGDFVLTSQNFTDSKKWCLIKNDMKFVTEIFDKKSDLKKSQDLYALIGVYYFSNLTKFRELRKHLDLEENIEISHLIEERKKEISIKSIQCKQWYDVGHIENYYISKKLLLQTRFFNYLKFDDVLGIVTKTSDDAQKLNDEIEWYRKIPIELSILTPRIIDSNQSTKPFIKLEYVGYPTLAELWLFSDIHIEVWKNILNRLLNVINLFKKHGADITRQDYESMYINKTEERLENLISTNNYFKTVFQNEIVIINDNEYKNWPVIKEKIYSKTKRLYNAMDNCFIHGDLCCSNILYDVNNGIFKMIDPRGKWSSSVFGDIKYDIAKLRHSIVGNYDSIINGLYLVEHKNNQIKVDIFKPSIYKEISAYYDKLIKKYWNIEDIKLIEGLLFISMLPLHKESLDKQIAMYSVGIQRLNEVVQI